MKFLAILALFSSFHVFASDCKVYGISDSPQHLSCTFPEKVLKLSCQSGVYLLNSDPVSMAFHMEVEDGPVPLVFKASSSQLTLVKLAKNYHAELLVSGQTLQGECD